MGEIKLDANNYRVHDERDLKLIKKSLKECGAGRSILIDADGEIIARNATYQTAREANIPVKIIQTDGKDLSKADCSVNIYCFLRAKREGKEQKAICSIGDEKVNINGELVDFSEIVNVAHEYVVHLGGFEKLAEWGLR